jgi:hypothetical protein
LNQRTFTDKPLKETWNLFGQYMKKFTIKVGVADPDAHHFGKLDLDPEPHFGALEGPNLEKSKW